MQMYASDVTAHLIDHVYVYAHAMSVYSVHYTANVNLTTYGDICSFTD